MEDTLKNVGLTHLIFYIGLCVFYMILLFNSSSIDTFKDYNFLLFFSITFILQIALNFADINNPTLCKNSSNSYKLSLVLIHTIIPWTLILGLGHLLINFLPGWLRIFSNTIGMSWAYETYKINIPNTATSTITDPVLKSLYYQVLQKPKQLFNEIDILGKSEEEINNIYAKLKEINVDIFTDQNKDSILKLLMYKNNIGYGIWYMLLGLIAVMISTNSLISSNCNSDF